jgi:hypothetical protein
MKNATTSASSIAKTLTLKVVKADIKSSGLVPVGLAFQHR